MQWGGKSRASDRAAGPIGGEHRYVESRLKIDLSIRTESLEKSLVRRTTSQKDMLPVVKRESISFDRCSESAESMAPLDERDFETGIRERECRRYPRQAPTDHADTGRIHDRADARLPSATATFSKIGTVTRP